MQYANYNALILGLNNLAKKLEDIDKIKKEVEEKYGEKSAEYSYWLGVHSGAIGALEALGGQYDILCTDEYYLTLAGIYSSNPLYSGIGNIKDVEEKSKTFCSLMGVINNMTVEYDTCSNSDLNKFAKSLNNDIPDNLEWESFPSFRDVYDWPKTGKYYWVIGITKNVNMEL